MPAAATFNDYDPRRDRVIDDRGGAFGMLLRGAGSVGADVPLHELAAIVERTVVAAAYLGEDVLAELLAAHRARNEAGDPVDGVD